MERETVGKISSDLARNAKFDTHSAYEQMREQLSGYEDNLRQCVAQMVKDWPNQDFYVVVLTKREKLTPNVFRHYFFGRLSCPTPNYDQILYSYSYKDDQLLFLWVIPDRGVCMHYTQNPALVHPEEMGLLKHVLDFKDGTLFRIAQHRNGELSDKKGE